MINSVLTISQLVTYLKNQFENDYLLANVQVKGEVGNFTNHSSGHWYFSLKDENAFINCAMFRNANRSVDFLPKAGDKVIISGSVTIFEKNGQLQIVARTMKLDGAGDFYAMFEQTKNKLVPLGYFDIANKKKLPLYPMQISVVAGANTAALRDIHITLANRWPVAKIIDNNAIVQGNEAVKSIISALLVADSQNSDVIILARGGGSVDDLWCFNDEQLAKIIFNLKTPIVTGIGHEIDTTIADLVADVRAATPTAAATAACSDINKVLSDINTMSNKMNISLTNKIQNYYQSIDNNTTKLKNYLNTTNKYSSQIDLNMERMINSLQSRISFDSNNLVQMKSRIANSLNITVTNKQNQIDIKQNQLVNDYSNLLKSNDNDLRRTIAILDSLSPMKTLSRGYIISSQNGKILKSINDVDYNSNISLQYADGMVQTKPIKE